jgi:hypothetical protein
VAGEYAAVRSAADHRRRRPPVRSRDGGRRRRALRPTDEHHLQGPLATGDGATKKIGASANGNAAVAAAGDSYRAKILGLLDSGQVHQAGRETINGRDAIRLVSDDGSVTLLVDADSYEPIEWRVSQDGREAVTSFPVYEHLPATDANAALVSLTGRHPGAALDDDPADYQAALERLNPKLR